MVRSLYDNGAAVSLCSARNDLISNCGPQGCTGSSHGNLCNIIPAPQSCTQLGGFEKYALIFHHISDDSSVIRLLQYPDLVEIAATILFVLYDNTSIVKPALRNYNLCNSLRSIRPILWKS